MTDFKVGDVCTCREHPQCFFVPGSVVIVTEVDTNANEDCVSAKLLFGEYKDDSESVDRLRYNRDMHGAVYCFLSELEKIHD